MTYVLLTGDELIRFVVAVAAAYLLALPLGWERKRHAQAYFGIRVFPLVAVSACVYVFLGQKLFIGEHENEQADVLQGLITGIGFVGAGAIIKESGSVRGVATAASIWTTAAIGAAVAYGYFALALALALVNLFILYVTWKLAQRAEQLLRSEGDDDKNEDDKKE